MKLLKPKKVPKKIIKFLFMAYKWGYSDSQKGLDMKSQEEVEESVNRGYKKGKSKG